MGPRVKRVGSSVVPAFSRSADHVSRSAAMGFKAARGLPRPLLVCCGAVLTGMAVIIAMAIGGVTARAGQDNEFGIFPAGTGQGGGPVPDGPGSGSPARSTGPAVTTGVFDGIILPDLLIVLPSGLRPSDVSGLRSISGVRKMITFDGAQIGIDGRRASVIGVNPDRFRSWVPLRAASDNGLWTKLAAGGFIASSPAARRLGLSGGSYRLTARTQVDLRYAGSARVNIAGVDLLVNQDISRKLGLVHRVAALISAPGPGIAALTAQVRRVLGARAKVVDLRGRRPVSSGAPPRPDQIASYLQLFQASAAKYCPQMSWTVLAAIGQIESADGQNMGPSSAGALGPMQFLPSTWAEWGINGFGPPGLPDIMNPFDAVPSAARMLCADGASSGTRAGLRRAVFAYNHADWYVNEVLVLAGRYAAEYR
ncbi:MAG: lytic murein transglycosylase [Streptosporangiaceae bacterium]